MVVEIWFLGQAQSQLFSPVLGPCTEDSQVSYPCEKTLKHTQCIPALSQKVKILVVLHLLLHHAVSNRLTMFMNESKPLQYLKHNISHSGFRKQPSPAPTNKQNTQNYFKKMLLSNIVLNAELIMQQVTTIHTCLSLADINFPSCTQI